MCMVLGASVSFTSCKDYDDDIEALDERVSTIEKDLKKLSEDFGALAYVKSVSYDKESGKLIVTPSVGEAVTYVITSTDANTEYVLETVEIENGVKIILKEKNGTVVSEKEINFPEAAPAFDPSKLTYEDGKIKYDGEDTGVSINIPQNPGLTILEIKNSLGEIIGYSIKYGDDPATTLMLISGKLQSLVFVPEFYYQGIEAMGAYTIAYAEQFVNAVNADEDNSDDKPTSGAETSLTPRLVASYHMNPSNVSADLLPVENMSFIVEDKAYTKAGGVVDAEIFDRKIDKGILTVTAKLSDGIIKDIEKDEQVTVLALQVGTKGEKGDTLITSDYAAVKANPVKDFILGIVAEEDLHLYQTAAEAIKGEKNFEIVWNDEKGVDVALLVNTHYGKDSHKKWDKNAADGSLKNYGLKYKYELVGWMDGANKTSQSAHAAMNGSILRAQMTKDGKQQPFGAEQSPATIGRMPIVRVILEDTVSHKNVAVGYAKFEIVKDQVAPEEDTFDVFKFALDEAYTTICPMKSVSDMLDWVRMEEEIIAKLGISKADFEASYDLEGFENAGQSTGAAATQFSSADLKAEPVVTPIGTIVRTTSDEDPNMTEVLKWSLTENEAYDQFTAHSTIKAIVRYEKENNNGTHHYVYVELTWTPNPLHVTPAGEILDDASTKFTESWFAANSANQGWDEIHLNVQTPQSKGDADPANCIYEKDIVEVFTGEKVLISNIDEVYKGYEDENLTKTFKFITPDEKEVKGVDGKTYVLSVSADGKELIATEKNTVNSAKVAVLSDDAETAGNNIHNTYVKYQDNEIAKALLNYKGHKELKDYETLTAKMEISAVNKCGKPLTLKNNQFDVKFLRPITIEAKDNEGLQDAVDGGDVIGMAEILSFIDWRGFKFSENENYFGFYDVTAISVNPDAIMYGDKKLTDVYPSVQVSFTPATTISLEAMGELKWLNNKNTLSADIVISVPVEVSYKWGTVKVVIPVTVHKTIGQ